MSSDPATPKPKRQKQDTAALEAKLAEAQKQADTYLNQLKYVKADLENLQKQTQKRIDEAADRNNTRILTQLLPLADELALIHASNNDKGVQMIHGKLLKLLEAEGVKPIEAAGKPFDPYAHEAVVEVETVDCPAGTVVEEIKRGYTYREKVLRASLVKVARAPSKEK